MAFSFIRDHTVISLHVVSDPSPSASHLHVTMETDIHTIDTHTRFSPLLAGPAGPCDHNRSPWLLASERAPEHGPEQSGDSASPGRPPGAAPPEMERVGGGAPRATGAAHGERVAEPRRGASIERVRTQAQGFARAASLRSMPRSAPFSTRGTPLPHSSACCQPASRRGSLRGCAGERGAVRHAGSVVEDGLHLEEERGDHQECGDERRAQHRL